MKKRFLLKSLSCVLSLLFIFSLFCFFAAAETETGSSNASNPAAYVYVRDKANVFSDEQIQRIYQKILDERSKLDKKGKSVLFYVVTYPMDNSYDRYTGDDLLLLDNLFVHFHHRNLHLFLLLLNLFHLNHLNHIFVVKKK
ncbi:MAG: hypothetical protein II710_05935, partial [Clostridia bacterium]|nr:hypothetical protein [Clostridia bacterium]